MCGILLDLMTGLLLETFRCCFHCFMLCNRTQDVSLLIVNQVATKDPLSAGSMV